MSDADDGDCDPFADDGDRAGGRATGCSCGVVGPPNDRVSGAWVLGLFLWLGLRRRRT